MIVQEVWSSFSAWVPRWRCESFGYHSVILVHSDPFNTVQLRPCVLLLHGFTAFTCDIL